MPYIPDDEGQITSQQELDLSELSDTVPFVQVAVSSSAGLPSLPADAAKAVVQVNGGVVRWRPDGATTPPAVDEGMVLPDGSSTVLLYGHTALSKVRLVAASGAPVASVLYFAGGA